MTKKEMKDVVESNVSVATVATVEDVSLLQAQEQLNKLLADAEMAKKNLVEAQEKRRTELASEIETENTRHNEVMTKLNAELGQIETALGIKTKKGVKKRVSNGENGKVLPISKNGEKPESIQISASLWNKITKKPKFELKTLANHVMYVLSQNAEEELDTATIIAAVTALGYDGSSATFRTAVSACFNKLANDEATIKRVSRGKYQITTKGSKAVESLATAE